MTGLGALKVRHAQPEGLTYFTTAASMSPVVSLGESPGDPHMQKSARQLRHIILPTIDAVELEGLALRVGSFRGRVALVVWRESAKLLAFSAPLTAGLRTSADRVRVDLVGNRRVSVVVATGMSGGSR